jgi:hypothetical protein
MVPADADDSDLSRSGECEPNGTRRLGHTGWLMVSDGHIGLTQ